MKTEFLNQGVSKEMALHQVSRVTPDGDCLIFKGEKDKDGYGGFKEQINHVIRRYKAHRVAYELTHGPIPDGMIVMHTCDNPPCINPDHLTIGTWADNMQDMIRKGRKRWSVPTHCIHGHEFVEGAYLVDKRGWRLCKQCRAEYQRKYRAKKKAHYFEDGK